MGSINEIAKLQLEQMGSVANKGQSGTQKMVTDYKQKQSLRKSARRIGSESGGICDDENDWLSRQLREEKNVLKRMEADYGIRFFSSDARKLKAEHAIEHAIERYNGTRR